MSPQAGHPAPRIDYKSTPNTWQCWEVSRNAIFPLAGGASCVHYEGELMYWQVNPVTNSVGSTQLVNFWVQGARGTRTVCFRAYSYSLNGLDFSATSFVCPASGNFDSSLSNLSVPPYGTATVVASFSALAPNVMDGSEWNGVAWNYN
jgi:hypothetical protein